jgi:hypothetical protein
MAIKIRYLFMLIATCVLTQNSLFLLFRKIISSFEAFVRSTGGKIVANIWIMLLLWEIVPKLLFSRGCDKLFNEIFTKFYLCVRSTQQISAYLWKCWVEGGEQNGGQTIE